jgi:hypothetical protein
MAQRFVKIDIDGTGFTTILFEQGRLLQVHIDPGANHYITIKKVKPTDLVAGECFQHRFGIIVEEDPGPTFLGFTVATDSNSSMNLMPDGLQDYHIPPNTILYIPYHTLEDGSVASEAKPKGERERNSN